MPFSLLKILTILLTVTFILNGWSQSPTSYFDPKDPNIKYLEHLIKKGIDDVRINHGLKPLVNDSILYVAAVDHVQFLVETGRLSHYQPQNNLKRTPQLRTEFYGAVNYNVGENIAYSPYNLSNQKISGNENNSKSYGAIAKALVESWVNSPGHYKNIITPEYEITGVTVGMHQEKGVVFACQKFAHVEFRFVFEENKTFFPYSEYVPPPQINSFEEVNNLLIPKYKYPYKLRHDKLEKCADWPSKLNETPDISLVYDERRGFILRVENSDYVSQLIRNKWDGFAVEIVDYEDYACGSPYYYEKPSRRNGQLRLNGTILEPKFKDDLLRGFKKRKINKEVKFFNYIFRKDSVRFFKRFGQYKIDKYTSEYFEILLGRLPRNASRLFNHNLILIKDKQICDVYYFTQFCGDVFEEYKPTEFIPFQPDTNRYGFTVSPDELSFSISFQQGLYDFEKEAVLKNISSVSEYDFIIDSVKINAFSSIEGDSKINANLQLKRAENIADIFQGIQKEKIEKTITTAVNWNDFRREIKRNEETRPLNQLNNTALLKEVNQNSSQLEPQLAKTRRGDVKIYFHVIPNLKSLDYYIKKEMKRLKDEMKFNSKNNISNEYELDLMADLYKYSYAMMKRGFLDSTLFLDIELPAIKDKNPRLIQYYLLFGIEYPTIFTQFKDWKNDSIMYIDQFKETTKIEFIPEFNYFILRLLSEDLMESKKMSKKQFEALKETASYLQNYYENFERAKRNMDKINYNLNMLALNHYFKSDPEAEQKNAIMSLSQVYQYYYENGLVTDSISLKLSRIALFYQNPELAINLVFPYQNENDEIRAFVNEVGYTHISSPNSDFYYQKLINDFKTLPRDVWCNMFIKPCGIPFQVFDHEELRKLYCKECIGKNDFLNELYLGKYEDY